MSICLVFHLINHLVNELESGIRSRDHFQLESRPDVPRTENTEAARSRYPVVCYPNPENIISVYRPVMEFVNAVEHEVALIDSSLQAKTSVFFSLLFRR